MLKADLENIVEKIAKISGLSKEEIKRRIESKKEMLSGLISFEGAAQIVAAELGIKFDSIKLSIADLLPGMRRVKIIGKILEIYGIHRYVKNEKEMKVASLLLADDTDSIRVVLWDTKHIALIEHGKIKKDDTIEITNAYVRGDINNREIHLTNISDIALSSIKIENVVNKENFKLISQLTPNARAKIKGNIVQIFKPSFYNFCPVCNKAHSCELHETSEKKLLLPFIVDDGSKAIRCIAFSDIALKILGMDYSTELDEESLNKALEKVLGEEFWFVGRVRKNAVQDALEFVVNDAELVDVKSLIEKLQSL